MGWGPGDHQHTPRAVRARSPQPGWVLLGGTLDGQGGGRRLRGTGWLPPYGGSLIGGGVVRPGPCSSGYRPPPRTKGCSPAWSPAPGLTTLLTSLPDPEDSQLLTPVEAPDPGQRSVPAPRLWARRPQEHWDPGISGGMWSQCCPDHSLCWQDGSRGTAGGGSAQGLFVLRFEVGKESEDEG